MKKLSLQMACVALAMFTGAISAEAGQQADDWQVKRLLHPTAQQRASEQQGHVFIYDSLKEKVVDRAMEQGFDRIDSMMFINVKKNEDSGTSTTDVDADDADDDGCL